MGIGIYHTWKKVGILANGCRRYGDKNDTKWQKTTQNCQNQSKIKGKIRLISKDNFLVVVVFEIFSR